MSDGDGSAELHRFIADLGRIAREAQPEVRKIIKRGAQNVKTQMIAEARGSRWFDLAPAISYEVHDAVDEMGYDIGPDKDRAGGALGAIAYFGGSNGGGGTLDVDAPLNAETPRMMAALDAYLGGLT